MLGSRIKQFRCARGLSQDMLVERMGGIVSKQSISKYERSIAVPSLRVLNKIAKALDVKSANLWSEPNINVEFIAYRKGSGLKSTEQEKIEAQIQETLEECLKLSELTNCRNGIEIPVNAFPVRQLEDAEGAAESIRESWMLGLDPISSVTGMLEDKNVFVLEIEAPEKFDGISAFAKNTDDKKVVAAAVVSAKNRSGERQRLNLLHELGHLVLNMPEDANSKFEENAAFRFGAALLAPAKAIHDEVGSQRSSLSLAELLLLKERFGLSLQALVMRLNTLGVVSDSYKRNFFAFINKKGWKKAEPHALSPEKATWMERNVLKAWSENLISHKRAEQLLGVKLETEGDIPTKRRGFMALSLSERNKALSVQAKKTLDYGIDQDWLDMGEGYES
ncbi:MAG: hypothetical protein DRP56_07280 [Planctomycetota bacterium]|nr:MAG: hypothetical protein DRP56_07280 [Planctomycetota bacterium]